MQQLSSDGMYIALRGHAESNTNNVARSLSCKGFRGLLTPRSRLAYTCGTESSEKSNLRWHTFKTAGDKMKDPRCRGYDSLKLAIDDGTCTLEHLHTLLPQPRSGPCGAKLLKLGAHGNAPCPSGLMLATLATYKKVKGARDRNHRLSGGMHVLDCTGRCVGMHVCTS